MNNAELIKALRHCGKGGDIAERCLPCGYYDCEPWCEAALVNDAAAALEAAEKRIAEIEAQLHEKDCFIGMLKVQMSNMDAKMPKWTMLKDEMPMPHTNVLVSGIEAINNSRVYKVMVNDNGTLRPTDYAPSIRWDYWMPFGSPNCGARMRGAE